ncbi:MAG: phage portal protein, partial [Caulobacterales bacterium]|nr:phage portal protein [Caulobacterales bacterium]
MLRWLRGALGAPERKDSVARALIAWRDLGEPVWGRRDYAAFAREGYGRNPIAFRCVRLIAEAAASAPL